MDEVALRPVGHVTSSRSEPHDDDWDSETSSIELADEFGPEALAGLSEFSHVEVVFLFDRVPVDAVERGARHPRGNTDWPLVGVFAQRGKNRPNRLGTTVARVLSVEGRVLRLAGLDAIDGTPVLDIKPYLAEFAPRGETYQPAWAGELMRDYWNMQHD